MKVSRLLTGLIFVIVLSGPAMLLGEPAGVAFERGNALLAKGNFEGALEGYDPLIAGGGLAPLLDLP